MNCVRLLAPTQTRFPLGGRCLGSSRWPPRLQTSSARRRSIAGPHERMVRTGFSVNSASMAPLLEFLEFPPSSSRLSQQNSFSLDQSLTHSVPRFRRPRKPRISADSQVSDLLIPLKHPYTTREGKKEFVRNWRKCVPYSRHECLYSPIPDEFFLPCWSNW